LPLEGKTTRIQPDTVTTDIVVIPVKILSLHKKVVLTGDVIFINNLAFFVSLWQFMPWNGTVRAFKKEEKFS